MRVNNGLVLLCFLLVVLMSSSVNAQTTPPFSFETWFGYSPSDWVGLVVVACGTVIALCIPFMLGIRFLMRTVGWAKSAMSAR